MKGCSCIWSTGVLSEDDCDEYITLTTNVTVSTTGTVCFQCPSTATVMGWTIGGQSAISSVGATSASGFLAVFVAAQTFSVDTATQLVCMTDDIAAHSSYVTLQGETLDILAALLLHRQHSLILP